MMTPTEALSQTYGIRFSKSRFVPVGQDVPGQVLVPGGRAPGRLVARPEAGFGAVAPAEHAARHGRGLGRGRVAVVDLQDPRGVHDVAAGRAPGHDDQLGSAPLTP